LLQCRKAERRGLIWAWVSTVTGTRANGWATSAWHSSDHSMSLQVVPVGHRGQASGDDSRGIPEALPRPISYSYCTVAMKRSSSFSPNEEPRNYFVFKITLTLNSRDKLTQKVVFKTSSCPPGSKGCLYRCQVPSTRYSNWYSVRLV